MEYDAYRAIAGRISGREGEGVWHLGRGHFRKNGIEPNDRFVKTDGKFKTIWVVTQIVEFKNIPPHARMIQQGDTSRGYRTISTEVLVDPAFYQRLPPRPAPD